MATWSRPEPLPACPVHLTVEDRAAAAADRAEAEQRVRTYYEAEEPACWSWTLPHAAAGANPWYQLVDWQAERCAVCGGRVGRMVLDHDHDTGLVRGWLCAGCNISEGSSSSAVFVRYRARHPTALLGVAIPYRSSWGSSTIPGI